MNVELRDHIGRNMATGREERADQYRVWVDGRAVGYIGWGENDKLLLVVKLGPIETAEITKQVAGLMQRTVQSNSMPSVPVEMLTPQTQDIETYGGKADDDFNA